MQLAGFCVKGTLHCPWDEETCNMCHMNGKHKGKIESEDRKTLWEEFSFSIQAAAKTLASFISGQ